MTPLKLYLDEHGLPRVKSSTSTNVLKGFLEEDIQTDLDYTEELIKSIEWVKSENIKNYEMTGNAHTVTIDLKNAKIKNQFTNACYELPIEDFKDLVRDWLKFVEKL